MRPPRFEQSANFNGSTVDDRAFPVDLSVACDFLLTSRPF
jgi:hypothetical protein